MIKHFINLEWKSFFRSSSLGKSIGLKILMGFLAVYFTLTFLSLGLMLYPLINELFPGQNRLHVINSYVIIWLVIDLVFRFFMQSLPVMNIKPLMTIPVRRKSVINYVLLKSLFSFYNLIPLLVIIPFSIIYFVKEETSAIVVLAWVITIFSLALSVNYANFLLKKKFAENLKALLPYLIIALALIGLEYFDVFRITDAFGTILNYIIDYPLLFVIPVALTVGLYIWNFYYLKNNFYLDASLKSKAKEVSSADLSWTKRFGDIAPFLQLDLKLIWRNKRPKTTVWMSLIFILYGLIFYTNPALGGENTMNIFVGIFITGIFMINFGQFIPAWDSGYFSMMMSQNIPLKQYLASKYGLMVFSVIVLALLATPYIYFGVDIFLINLACAVYNIGVNIPVLLFAGAYNKKRIDLEKSPFMNYQGTGATQWIVGLPLMILPILLWYACYKIFNFETATAILALLGVTGIVLRNLLLNKIASLYKTKKYGMISGFKEQES